MLSFTKHQILYYLNSKPVTFGLRNQNLFSHILTHFDISFSFECDLGFLFMKPSWRHLGLQNLNLAPSLISTLRASMLLSRKESEISVGQFKIIRVCQILPRCILDFMNWNPWGWVLGDFLGLFYLYLSLIITTNRRWISTFPFQWWGNWISEKLSD